MRSRKHKKSYAGLGQRLIKSSTLFCKSSPPAASEKSPSRRDRRTSLLPLVFRDMLPLNLEAIHCDVQPLDSDALNKVSFLTRTASIKLHLGASEPTPFSLDMQSSQG